MLSEKLFPGCFPSSFRSRFDGVALEDVGNRAARQFMTEIGQRALDSQIAPVPVLRRHPDDQRFDLLRRRRPTRTKTHTTVVLVCDEPLLCQRSKVSGVTMVAFPPASLFRAAGLWLPGYDAGRRRSEAVGCRAGHAGLGFPRANTQ